MKNIKNNNRLGLIYFKGLLFSIICILVFSITNTACKKNNCDYVCTFVDSINISTGIDLLGNNNPFGVSDPNWVVTNSPFFPATPPAITTPHFPVIWETTPMVNTNAGWLNCTGSTCCSNLPGIYTFERTFNIPSGTLNFSCDFGIAYDDQLVSLELIEPTTGIVTNITSSVISTIPVTLISNNIGNVISNPTPGNWIIRTKINLVDPVGGFLTSGYVKLLRPC